MNDQAIETPRRDAMLSAPRPAPAPSDKTGREAPAQPPAPGPDQAPHEHPDDPGVHPDGPRRYHDDHATPARQRAGEGTAASCARTGGKATAEEGATA